MQRLDGWILDFFPSSIGSKALRAKTELVPYLHFGLQHVRGLQYDRRQDPREPPGDEAGHGVNLPPDRRAKALLARCCPLASPRLPTPIPPPRRHDDEGRMDEPPSRPPGKVRHAKDEMWIDAITILCVESWEGQDRDRGARKGQLD